jgi:hypothetical protein
MPLASAAEVDTNMQPRRPDPGDGRLVPWNIRGGHRAALYT